MQKDALNIKLGAPQRCPNCGCYNPSGKDLPEECLNRCMESNQPLLTRLQALAEEMEEVLPCFEDPLNRSYIGLCVVTIRQIAAELEKES